MEDPPPPGWRLVFRGEAPDDRRRRRRALHPIDGILAQLEERILVANGDATLLVAAHDRVLDAQAAYLLEPDVLPDLAWWARHRARPPRWPADDD